MDFEGVLYSFSATAGMDQLKETVTIGGMSNNSLKYAIAVTLMLEVYISGMQEIIYGQDVSNFIDFEGLSVQIRC